MKTTNLGAPPSGPAGNPNSGKPAGAPPKNQADIGGPATPKKKPNGQMTAAF